ncbi:MAG TPA: nucleotide-binding protein [Ktedonobacteraceae bacterium]|jgi:predicted nucleotide-binding protein
MSTTANSKKVFVVYGRNEKVKKEVFAFLRAIGLSPIPWEKAVHAASSGAPYIGEVLEVMLREAQAVVVLLTGDDEAWLISSEFLLEDDKDKEYISLHYRPRPNVVFEAGMAFSAWQADRTILVEIGEVRICQALAGRNRIKLSNRMQHRWQFANSLRDAGCAVQLPSNERLREIGNFNFK